MTKLKEEISTDNWEQKSLLSLDDGIEKDVYRYIYIAMRQKQLCSDIRAALRWASRIPMDMDLNGRKAFLSRANSWISGMTNEFRDNQQLLNRMMPDILEFKEQLTQKETDVSVDEPILCIEPQMREESDDNILELDMSDVESEAILEHDIDDIFVESSKDIFIESSNPATGGDIEETLRFELDDINESNQQHPVEDLWEQTHAIDSNKEETSGSIMRNLDQLMDYQNPSSSEDQNSTIMGLPAPGRETVPDTPIADLNEFLSPPKNAQPEYAEDQQIDD